MKVYYSNSDLKVYQRGNKVSNFKITQAQIRFVLSSLDITEETRKDYTTRINYFITYLRTKSLHINTLLEFKEYLKSFSDYSVSTKNKYLIAAKIFLRELYRLQILPVNITVNLKLFKQNKLHKRFGIDSTEAKAIVKYLNALPNNNDGIRIKALIMLLLYQGLRQIELVRINVEDIDIKQSKLLIQGKGNYDKEAINLHPITRSILKMYLSRLDTKSGALFLSNSNNSKGKRLSTKTVRSITKGIFKELNISKTTHGFRHYFTTNLIEKSNGNLSMVSKFTRHKTYEMVQIYNDELITKKNLHGYYRAFNHIKLKL